MTATLLAREADKSSLEPPLRWRSTSHVAHHNSSDDRCRSSGSGVPQTAKSLLFGCCFVAASSKAADDTSEAGVRDIHRRDTGYIDSWTFTP
jgi:hypothetical protein